MVITSFQVQDQQKKLYFFQKPILMLEIDVDFILKMRFFTVSNANIEFFKS